MAAWSNAISELIRSGLPVERSYTLEVRNGHQAAVGGAWTEVPFLPNWSVSHKDSNPVVSTMRFRPVMRDFEYLDEFDHGNAVQHFAACRLKCTVTLPGGGEESEYVFRGTIKPKQAVDVGLLVGCADPLDRMQRKLGPLSLEAEKDGPHADAELDHAAIWDTEWPGAFYTYELDRVVANDWGFVNEDTADKRRQWVAGVFIVEEETAPAVWEEVAASEFIIDEQNGLVRFHNDQGAAATFRLQEVTVYVEGTLELAWVIEEILEQVSSWDPACGGVGCGFTTSQLRTALTGTFTLTNGNAAVVGVGTDFEGELSEGDRIAHNATTDDYGIVESVTDATNLVLRYPYRGGTAGPLAGYKSTLRAASLSLSNINWTECDGTAADLYRQLRTRYADIRGYKLWYDHQDDKVRGDRVAIDEPNAVRLGPVVRLNTTSTTEDFYSAVSVTGIVGRAINLMTMPGVTVTPLATALPGWALGLSKNPGTSWDGITLDLTEPPAKDAINDTSLTHCYCVHNEGGSALESQWFDFYRVDLGAVWQLGELHYYNIPCKNALQFSQGVSLLGSLNVGGPWTPLTPETFEAEIEANEHRIFDCSASMPVRYILVKGRPFKWVASKNSRTMALRELIIFGTEQVCIKACIQDTVPAGAAPHTEGTGGHFIGASGDEDDWIPDYHPDLCAKMHNVGHQVLPDDEALVFTDMQAKDRAYLLLDECIRLYRQVRFRGVFDPRLRIFDTARVRDDYRAAPSAPEDLHFLVQGIEMTETGVTISGTEYGAGVLG